MTKVFADTSGWANFFIRTEPFYQQAKLLMQNWRENNARIITTNYVLSELIALFTSPLRIPRSKQIRVIDTIKNADWVEICYVDPSHEEEAWDLLKNRPDKDWSFVDCTSFVVMKHQNISKAFTADHHFEQAGFIRSLK